MNPVSGRVRRSVRAWGLAFGLALATIPIVQSEAAGEQTPALPDQDSQEIVITARRSGAPMWQVSNGDSTLVLVGEIEDVPKATPWYPDRLQAATTEAQRVVLGVKASVSVGDVFRFLWGGGKLKQLPKGRTTADYLSASQQARLEAIERVTGRSYARQGMLVTAIDLLSGQLRVNKDTADSATDVVRSAARRGRVAVRPVGTVRGEDFLDNLFEAPPERHVACLDAAMAAFENGPQGVKRRGLDWTRYDVPAVMASPIEMAFGRCWPWADEALGPELRRQWMEAVAGALQQPGITLAVVPLRILAAPDGILDRLDARDLPIEGPDWRAAVSTTGGTAVHPAIAPSAEMPGASKN